MPHIYLAYPQLIKEKIIIEDLKKIHYLKDVLRLKPKDILTLFDAQGIEYFCQIEEISKQKIILNINKKIFIPNILPRITIAFALIKKTKIIDDLVDKLTQLGVSRIIPMVTNRTIVNWDEAKRFKHINRWQKICISSSQQSKRNSLPLIDEIKNIDEVLKEKAELKLIFTISKETIPLKEIFNKKSTFKDILILIGPEGDFTPLEIDEAKKEGFIPVSLGRLILRSETASLAVVSFIRLYEDN
jgi:16S rRNA (uracil1498-N3)-methyltransferase